jgi:UDP-N-acetylglucosamine--dolichyl-phosphate N-acetylglucosaminephosphotransferase
MIPLLVSFLTVIFLMPFWIRKVRSIGLVWDNMNRLNSPKLAGSGGMMVLLAFCLSVLFYIAYMIFSLGTKNGSLVEIFALLIIVIFMGFIGFVDDLFGWRQGGLSMNSRLILALLGSIPLIAINAGKSLVELPFFGIVELGLIYPLFFIPLAVVATTTTFNMFAGFNGLEAGQAAILFSGFALVSYVTGNPWLSVICLCLVVALISFLIFNWYPAKVLPGDVLTYAVGGLIAAVCIVGNFERIAVFFYIPYILEVCLKLRGNLNKYSFGKPLPNDSLDLLYDRIYSLNHLAIYLLKKFGIKPTEKRAVLLLYSFQILIIIIGLFIFRENLFV